MHFNIEEFLNYFEWNRMLSHRSVDVAARMALVEYNTENIDSPILTVKDAVEKSSFWV